MTTASLFAFRDAMASHLFGRVAILISTEIDSGRPLDLNSKTPKQHRKLVEKVSIGNVADFGSGATRASF